MTDRTVTDRKATDRTAAGASLVLFDDQRAREWEPFSLTRPVGSLWYGAMRLAERASRTTGMPVSGYAAAPHLQGWIGPGIPRISQDWSPKGGPTLFLNSRFAASLGGIPPSGPAPATLFLGELVVGWILPAGQAPPEDALLDPAAGFEPGSAMEVQGELLDWPWTLMSRNGHRLQADLAAQSLGGWPRGTAAPHGVHVMGDGGLHVEFDTTIEPGVVLDTRSGPIHLSRGVVVRAFTRLSGPAFVGPDSVLLGGELGNLTVGRTTRIRGEVADSVVGDFVNKAHEGHLGHAVLGDWVNLGAGTTNSDLKNSYGEVRVLLDGGEVDTGLIKVGSFLGDHVKTGIGTLLPTGAVVGAGSNVFPGGMAPRRVEPFRWQGPDGAVPYRFQKFLEVANRAMARRGEGIDEIGVTLLHRAWREAHGE